MSKQSGKKLDPSFWLSLFFLGVITVLVITAAGFDWDTRLFPWAIGLPALALALRQVIADWQGVSVETEGEQRPNYPGILDLPTDRSVAPEVMARHTLRTGIWILGFACGIWFLGFLISIPIFVFWYLLYEAQASKTSSFTVAALTFLFVWGLFDAMMHLAWPEATLLKILGF
jgi:hypothetical protein